jgi:predicted nucleic acid-binding protein
MTSWIVADSSFLIASVFKEKYTAQARKLLRDWARQDTQLAAPTLLKYELAAAVRKNVYRGILSTEQAEAGLRLLARQVIQFLIDDKLVRRAYELATQLNRPSAYDAQYLAVAERLGCDFWTADEKLFNAVRQQLTWVRWLGNFTGTA